MPITIYRSSSQPNFISNFCEGDRSVSTFWHRVSYSFSSRCIFRSSVCRAVLRAESPSSSAFSFSEEGSLVDVYKRQVKFIGYDAGEGYRSDKVLLGDLADRKYSKWYPLMEWGWTRDDCIRQIEAAGLPQPGKSSCFFCPSMKPDEITALREQHPDLFRRALALEDNARQNLKTVKGLGRNYSWRERFGKEFCTHGNG